MFSYTRHVELKISVSSYTRMWSQSIHTQATPKTKDTSVLLRLPRHHSTASFVTEDIDVVDDDAMIVECEETIFVTGK